MQNTQNSERQAWLSLMAKAPSGRLSALFQSQDLQPAFDWLRKPEVGSVMLQGRAGGTGAPFNVGEMTVTRCSVKLSSGEVGHGYVQGRSKADAEAAALTDALMQTDADAALRLAVLTPLSDAIAAEKETRARKAAATKVDFFTMARGED